MSASWWRKNNTIAVTVYAGPFRVSLVCAPEFNLLNLVFSIPSAWWHLLCAPKTAAQETTGKVTVSWLCFWKKDMFLDKRRSSMCAVSEIEVNLAPVPRIPTHLWAPCSMHPACVWLICLPPTSVESKIMPGLRVAPVPLRPSVEHGIKDTCQKRDPSGRH